MKKIWIGGLGSCSVHQRKEAIKTYLANSGYEIINKGKDADLVIISDTCVGTYDTFIANFEYIEKVLSKVKPNTPIIVSGCLMNGVKFDLTEKQKEILSKVICVEEKDLIAYVSKMILGEVIEIAYDVPFSANTYTISINPTFGCLNNCSFCKKNYANFALRSEPFEKVENLASDLGNIDYPISFVEILSSNLSLYGVDLYKKQRAHEVIRVLTKPEKIKFAYVGTLINWYKELVDEIINNPKVKNIFVSLESGSPRVYELMNRPISLENLIRLIKFIRKERPDIVIHTEVIAGFPTETLDDLKKTIDLITELDIYPDFVWPYQNSEQIPASKLPQHSREYCCEAGEYIAEHLRKLHFRFKDDELNRELLVLKKYDEGFYLVMTTDGCRRYIGFNQLDRQYEVGELILPNSVVPKQIIRKRKNVVTK